MPTHTPKCSKPTVTDAMAVNLTYFTMTVTPVTSSPYTSYPPGGWTHYMLNTTSNSATALDWCT